MYDGVEGGVNGGEVLVGGSGCGVTEDMEGAEGWGEVPKSALYESRDPPA